MSTECVLSTREHGVVNNVQRTTYKLDVIYYCNVSRTGFMGERDVSFIMQAVVLS